MDIDIANFRFPSPLTVSEINEFIKSILDETPPLTDVFVKGEISNFKWHSSGHLYFTLKDETSNLKSVMFRSDAQKLTFTPENGMKVIAHGRISSFIRDGAYQLYVNDIQPDGIGAMYIAIEQLKKKLEDKGYTSDSRKKKIPKIPRKIGVVTSPTGAAIRDIINVTGRRFPLAELYIYPALVQGEGAIESVAKGIEFFNRSCKVDVMIVGRGGGSIEDLWAFNSERVAMAVVSSNIPIISAVGHETDFTICDMVSDLRAPTPSAAAEVCVPDTEELKQKFNNIISKEKSILLQKLNNYKSLLNRIENSRVLQSPMNSIQDRQMIVSDLMDRMERAQNNFINKNTLLLEKATGQLNALSPLSVLSRGYSVLYNENNNMIKSINDTEINQDISVHLNDGDIKAKVVEIIEKR